MRTSEPPHSPLAYWLIRVDHSRHLLSWKLLMMSFWSFSLKVLRVLNICFFPSGLDTEMYQSEIYATAHSQALVKLYPMSLNHETPLLAMGLRKHYLTSDPLKGLINYIFEVGPGSVQFGYTMYVLTRPRIGRSRGYGVRCFSVNPFIHLIIP